MRVPDIRKTAERGEFCEAFAQPRGRDYVWPWENGG